MADILLKVRLGTEQELQPLLSPHLLGFFPTGLIAKEIFRHAQILEVSGPETSIFTRTEAGNPPRTETACASDRRRSSDVTKKQQYVVAEDTDMLMNEARGLERIPSPLPRPWLCSTFSGKCAVALIQKFQQHVQKYPPMFSEITSFSESRRCEDVRTGYPDTLTDPSLRGETSESHLRRRQRAPSQESEDPDIPTYRSDPRSQSGPTEVRHSGTENPETGVFTSSEVLDCTDVLFWTTKSLVQPQGELSEVETRDRLASGYPNVAREWFQSCWDVEGVTNVPEALADVMVDVQGRF